MKYTKPEKKCYSMFATMPITIRKGIKKTYETNGKDHAVKIIGDLIDVEGDINPKESKEYIEYIVDAIINMCDDEGLIRQEYRNKLDNVKIKVGDEFVLTDRHVEASKKIWQQTAAHMINVYQNSDGISLYYHSADALEKMPFFKMNDEERERLIISVETVINMFEPDGTLKAYYKLLDKSSLILN